MSNEQIIKDVEIQIANLKDLDTVLRFQQCEIKAKREVTLVEIDALQKIIDKHHGGR